MRELGLVHIAIITANEDSIRSCFIFIKEADLSSSVHFLSSEQLAQTLFYLHRTQVERRDTLIMITNIKYPRSIAGLFNKTKENVEQKQK